MSVAAAPTSVVAFSGLLASPTQTIAGAEPAAAEQREAPNSNRFVAQWNWHW